MSAVAGGTDSSGYLINARLLASGHVHVPSRELRGLPEAGAPSYLYVPLGLKPHPSGAGLVPAFPPGLSLMVLLARPLAGWGHAAALALVLNSLLGVAATFALARLAGLGAPACALCAAVVAASPLYLLYSIQAMSDVPSLAWTTAAVVAALWSRRMPAWALASGLALSLDVLLRPSNILALAPVAVAIGISPRRWALLVCAGLPGAAFLWYFNAGAYGSPVLTGYGDFWNVFSLGYVPGTLLHYLRWLPVLFTPAVLLAPALPFLRSVGLRLRWALAAWMAAYGAFYAAYVCTHETWWYLRFLLPMAPALVVSGFLAIRPLLSRAPAAADPLRSLAPAAVVAALLVANTVYWSHRISVVDIGPGEEKYGRVAEWLRAHAPRDAACLCAQESGALFYYTDFVILRWDSVDPACAERIRAAVRRSGQPVYAALFPYEIAEKAVLTTRLPGDWEPVGAVDDVSLFRLRNP
jgi:hypothetical protein